MDTAIDSNLALYRLLRSNAVWFIQRNDGYSISPKSGTVEIKKGSMVARSKEFYRQCVDLWKPIIEGVSKVPTVDIAPHNKECICPKCLAVELKRLYDLRVDRDAIDFDVEE